MKINTLSGYMGGDLHLEGENFKSLPDNLHVSGSLYMWDCEILRNLPNNLQVDGCLNLSNCVSLVSIPPDIKIGIDLCINGCTSLQSLPYLPLAGNSLTVNNCTSLLNLPNNLNVFRLHACGCTSLQSLPVITVKDRIDCRDCTSLISVSQINGGHNLWFDRCTSLKYLPKGLKISGYLDVQNCTSLEVLPHDLIARSIVISGCKQLFEGIKNVAQYPRAYSSDAGFEIFEYDRAVWCSENDILVVRKTVKYGSFEAILYIIENDADFMHFKLKWD